MLVQDSQTQQTSDTEVGAKVQGSKQVDTQVEGSKTNRQTGTCARKPQLFFNGAWHCVETQILFSKTQKHGR